MQKKLLRVTDELIAEITRWCEKQNDYGFSGICERLRSDFPKVAADDLIDATDEIIEKIALERGWSTLGEAKIIAMERWNHYLGVRCGRVWYEMDDDGEIVLAFQRNAKQFPVRTPFHWAVSDAVKMLAEFDRACPEYGVEWEASERTVRIVSVSPTPGVRFFPAAPKTTFEFLKNWKLVGGSEN